MCESFWIMLSAIASALMAIATFITIAITLKQNREAVRARLLFSIVRKEDDVYLKIANVGSSVARDIRIRFSQNFKDMLIVNSLKERYDSLEKISFSIDAKDAKYYIIIPSMDRETGRWFVYDKEKVSQNEINEWHKKYDKVEFSIEGTYNDRYDIKERMSIYGFLNVGAVEINEVASVLRIQNDLLRKIEKSLQPLRVVK